MPKTTAINNRRYLGNNDTLYSNYISNLAWFTPQEYDEDKIIQFIIDNNSVNIWIDNYMSNNFADTFFSKQDCRKIGYIREDIVRNFMASKLNERACIIDNLVTLLQNEK